ncbi:MAG TPA: cytochrome C [Anaeromyxobacteraceae bacterium]
MSLRAAAATAVACALALAAAAPAASPPARSDLRPAPARGAHAGETRCDACHSTEAWGGVDFAHERTGFPLVGGHKRATCKQCHPVSFTRPVSRECTTCHRDTHRGQLGAMCRSCHDEESWKSRFDADAHRRRGFPLSGRHAFIPCQECHGDQLNRGFARPVSTCFDCHERDYLRAGVVAIDHVASGFGTDCKHCHGAFSFRDAFFPAHERCFAVATGPHAGIRCLGCHSVLGSAVATGTCSTNTANCIKCHDCARTGPKHTGVAGYQCFDRKCYECHRFSTFTGPLQRGLRSR